MTDCLYVTGDVFDVLAQLPDNSVDLVLTSPPFLALRSYLPGDHADKAKEIGSEPTPAAFLDTLLALTAEWGRVLAPHGSICVELGDTYSGSGGAGGDYGTEGLRAGQAKFDGSARRSGWHRVGARAGHNYRKDGTSTDSGSPGGGTGWPLAKSMVGIPHLYHLSLAYGRNILTGQTSPAGQWRVRNVVAWTRPNPPVGCVDDQTEALTPDGWKRHDQLSDGDLIAAYDPRTDSCRFQPAKFVRWHRDGEPMVAIDKRVATSQRLTEDHRVWTRTRKTAPHVRLARDLTNDCETLLCAPFDDIPGPAPVTTERAAILGWYIAEGSTHNRQARIAQSATANPKKVAAIRALLDRDGCDYSERVYRRPVDRQGRNISKPPYDDAVTFTIKGELAEWLNLHHKRLPMAYVTTWPEAQAQALFDALIDGDGHRRKNAEGVLFHQQDEAVIDAMQVLALRLGYRAIKTWQAPMRIWQLTLSKDCDRRSVRWTKVRTWEGEGIRRESYTGVVWCPQIETSFWLARRNGRTFITGNSLGDKFRPATSYLTVACRATDRYFDLDAVRGPVSDWTKHYAENAYPGSAKALSEAAKDGPRSGGLAVAGDLAGKLISAQGAPPLDHWNIPTFPYKNSHFACFPPALCETPIKAMVPFRVCRTCGQPSRRIVESELVGLGGTRGGKADELGNTTTMERTARSTTTVGWTSCEHDNWRNGRVLDPFGGSGTVGQVATGHGRDALLIDLDSRNVELAEQRVGPLMFRHVTATEAAVWLGVEPFEVAS